jgi:glycosyltransferase involved in cell wall biosynthesis
LEGDGEAHLPKVSIVVPVKNGVKEIRDLLESLMQINYDKSKLEIIVVDGCSTDGTREIVSRYPVRLLVEERPGVNIARNVGIKNSTGEIIAFTDHDCVVPRDWIKRIVENLKDPEVGCVGGQVIRYYDDFLARYADESIIPVMRAFNKKVLLSRISSPAYYPVGCNFAVKRKVLEEAGFFDERFEYGFDELEFAERICSKGYKILLTPEIIIRHKHRSSVSELLKQSYRYGQGGGLIPKIKGVNSTLSKWILLSITAFSLWFSSAVALAVYAMLTCSIALLLLFCSFLFFPLTGLVVFYAFRALRSRDGMYKRILVYPLLDIARSLAFITGAAQHLLKPSGKCLRKA